MFKVLKEAEPYIKGCFTRHTREVRCDHGQEAYEFNIKGFIPHPDYVSSEDYERELNDILETNIFDFKGAYPWIREAYTVGRSGGWLVLTTYEPVWDGYQEERYLGRQETLKRANDLKAIECTIRERIRDLVSMSAETAETYWEHLKPEDWDEQLQERKAEEDRKREARQARYKAVTDYVPTGFHYLETSHRQFVLNDRGDILLTKDKMCRGSQWDTYGQRAGNGLVGLNRITGFTELGVAPRHATLDDALSRKAVGMTPIVYNAPTGQSSYGGLGMVSYFTSLSAEEAHRRIQEVIR